MMTPEGPSDKVVFASCGGLALAFCGLMGALMVLFGLGGLVSLRDSSFVWKGLLEGDFEAYMWFSFSLIPTLVGLFFVSLPLSVLWISRHDRQNPSVKSRSEKGDYGTEQEDR